MKCSDASEILGVRDVSGSYMTHSSLSVSEAALSQYGAVRGPRLQHEVLQGPQRCSPPHEDGVRVSGKSPQEMWRGQWLSDIALELFCGVVGG